MSHTSLEACEMVEYGTDAGRGNLLGIQPFMSPADYASEAALHAKLDDYLCEAGRQGWLNERTVAVLPEYIGTWLAFAGEGPGALRARGISAAAWALALRHPIRFAGAWWSAREADRVTASLFRIKAASMARIYQAVFSRLAVTYRVTVVAGSILIPTPRVREGRVEAGTGPLQNVSAVYQPDDVAHAALVRNSVPVTMERPFVAAAPVADLPVFDTPAGRLGVLICADAWYPASYERLKAQGVELIAVPSGMSSREEWDGPWRGYDGAPAPDDMEPRDVGVLSEGQAWRKYALSGRIAQAGARFGILVALRGALWDLGADGGRSTMVHGESIVESSGDGAAVLNLWL